MDYQEVGLGLRKEVTETYVWRAYLIYPCHHVSLPDTHTYSSPFPSHSHSPSLHEVKTYLHHAFLAWCFLPWHKSILKAMEPANHRLKPWVKKKILPPTSCLFQVFYHSHNKITNTEKRALRCSLSVLIRMPTTQSQKLHCPPLSLIVWKWLGALMSYF